MRTWCFGLFCVALAGCSAGAVSTPTPSAPQASHNLPSSADRHFLGFSLAGESGAASYSVLYAFKGGSDGANPLGALVSLNNTLYGMTSAGGANGTGTVFSVSASGAERVLHSFGTGGTPRGALIAVNGTLYGTTEGGGALGAGTVFDITTAGVEQTLYSFGETSKDCEDPFAGLLYVNGELYGTTYTGGGGRNYGCVFRVSTSGVEQVVYRFGLGANGATGASPDAPLIDVDGELYGTTENGGALEWGTAFKVSPSGAEQVLHAFGSVSSDGESPEAGLVDVDGTLYGTTSAGGAYGYGTVFALSTSGTETVLYSFTGGADGANPLSSLISVNGMLYGTTSNGGGGGTYCEYGCGTVFKVSTSGKESVVHTFTATDGVSPAAGLIDVNGALYGTTSGGGLGGGTVYKLVL